MIALFLLILVDSISATVIIPLLGPLLIEPATLVFLPDAALPLRNFVSGLLVAVYVLMMLYMAPVLGRLSDQWGRRPVLLLCGAGVLLGNLLAGIAIELHLLPLLFLSRLIGGATAGAQPSAQAALVDMGSNKARLLSYSMLFSSLGFVLGPVVASALSTISFSAPLHLCTLLTLIALVLLLASYREADKPGRKVDWSSISIWEGVRCFRDAAGDRAVRGLLGCFLLMQVAWGSFFVFVSIYLMGTSGLQMSLTQVGAFMSIMGIGFCISNGLVQPALAERFGMRSLAVAGLGLNAATMVLCLMLTSIYQAYAVALIAGITVNVAYPSIVTLLSDRVAAERQGWILGMVGSTAAMGWGISSLVSGALGGLGHALPVMLAAGLMAGAALAMTVAGSDRQSAGATAKARRD
ncbi:MFS transporter [Azorhizobium doebereinerae]|uniref:MFS transporter n=1 Tax=Azorhizobium doebereinerae TaxID=281091 RepID=UPI0003FE8C5F|nr:MFS transporter [Azorhizobium doebereinerae]